MGCFDTIQTMHAVAPFHTLEFPWRLAVLGGGLPNEIVSYRDLLQVTDSLLRERSPEGFGLGKIAPYGARRLPDLVVPCRVSGWLVCLDASLICITCDI